MVRGLPGTPARQQHCSHTRHDSAPHSLTRKLNSKEMYKRFCDSFLRQHDSMYVRVDTHSNEKIWWDLRVETVRLF